jgi:uncharacterized protein YfaS (alpha-2-macroglobulin family)
MEITWLTDDTVRVSAVIRDFPEVGETEGDLLDPTSNTVIFYDPDGVAQGTPTAGSVGQGTYNADFIIPSDALTGQWKVSWKCLFGSYPAREILYFEVAEG